MSAEGHGILGIEGRLRCVQHDVRGMKGSGPGGAVDFDDLWTVDEVGTRKPKHPERIIEDRTIKNKFTKRGLSYLLRTVLKSHSGTDQSKQPTDITYGWSNNPFQAFVLIGDDGAVPVRRGDARVLWEESDGQYDDKIAAGSGVAVYGRRGLLLSLTTGIFKRVQIRYPNASPDYEQLEYTFFAQANTVKQDGPTGGDVGIDDFVAKSIALAYGVACGYNEASSQVGSRAILGVAATHQGYADRLYKHEWFGQGDGSAEGQGTVPATRHANGTNPLSSLYDSGEAIDGDGWVSSNGDAADVSISALTGVSITITAATKRIQVTGAAFTSAHTRKTLKIRNMTTAGNNLDYTIKRVVDADEVEVFETPAGDETDASADADLVTRTWAQQAFDGRVENEGLVGKGTYDADAEATIIQGEKWISTDAPGPHYLGRIWTASKKIAGVRVVFPKGSIRDFCPNRLQIQTLTSGNPEGGTWTTQVDHSGTDQASNIFDNGEYGYEYLFGSPVTTQGVRLYINSSADTLRKAEVGELYIFEVRDGDAGREWLSIAAPNNALRHAVDGVPTYRASTIPAVANTASVQTIVDAINRRLYAWGLEAYRSTFGFLWIRATVAGSYAQLHIDSNANGSTINASLGLSTSAVAKTGVTQPFTKAQANAVTFIYTLRMAGNLPKPYDF